MGLFSSSKKTVSHKETTSHIADCYTRSDVPGRTIEKSIGLIHFTKENKCERLRDIVHYMNKP